MSCKPEFMEEMRLLDKSHSTKETRNGYNNSESLETTKDTTKETLKGYGLLIFGKLMIIVGQTSTQMLYKTIPHSQLNGFRFVGQLVLICPLVAVYDKCDLRVERCYVGYVILLALALTVNSYLLYGSCYFLPIGIANSIYVSFTVMTTVIIGSIINRGIKACEIIAVVMCLSGILLLVPPKFIFGDSAVLQLRNTTELESPCGTPIHLQNTSHYWPSSFQEGNSTSQTTAEQARTEHLWLFGYFLCFGAALTTSIEIIIMRHKLENFSLYNLMFWDSVTGILVSFTIMSFTETLSFPSVSICVVLIFVHMFSAGSHAICNGRAYQLLDPIPAGLASTLVIPFSFVVQYVGIPGMMVGRANATEISGAICVLLGNICIPLGNLIKKFHKSNSK